MRKILLPPVVTLVCALAIVGTGQMEGASHWHQGAWDIVGASLVLLGILLPVWGARAFKRHETNILPYKDPDNMVTDGPFKFTRNPMYLGMMLVLAGAATIVGTKLGLIFPLVFFGVANWWYIPFEESRMAEAFGDKFTEYKSQVRRWI